MKTRYLTLCLLTIAGLGLSGCATETTTTTTTAAHTDPNARVHTQKQMKKTGESETGEALEKVDASVTTSGSR